MSTPLRPMSTGEILDRTFNLYRNNFVLFAGIAVVPPALMLVVQLIRAGMVATPGHPRAASAGLAAAGGIGIFAGWLAYLVGMAVAHAATVFAVSAVHLERTTTIGESYGNVHLCQGLSMGNLWETPLPDLVRRYDAQEHPIVGPLLRGGPLRLSMEHGLQMNDSYVDECHFCYAARKLLLSRFPRHLAPKEAYGL